MDNLLENLRSEIVENRRYLHGIPETGFNEFKTSEYIKAKLHEYGFEVISTAKTGVVGFKKGSTDEKAIAFRADMDALNVTEKTGVPFASKNENKMHACGHDGHMSILLGFAKYISNIENLKRDLVLIFQPAEEGPGGAELIIEEGILSKYNVESIFGLHILPDIEEGKVGCKPGPLMAEAGEIDVYIKSKSGHGAIPHTAIDGIYIASQLINTYQSVISRNINPLEGAVLTIGEIHGGQARNVIAEDVVLKGTIRAFDENIYNLIKKRILDINEGFAKMHDIQITTEIRDLYPAVVNDEKLFNMFKDIIGEDNLVVMKPMMISEDFSYYQKEVPGLFFMLGSKNEDQGYIYPLHNSKFNFNEDILLNAVDIYVNICKELNVF